MPQRILRSSALVLFALLVLSAAMSPVASAAAADPPETAAFIVAPAVAPDTESRAGDWLALLEDGVCPNASLEAPAPSPKVDQCASCTPSTPCPKAMCSNCAGGPYCNASTQCTCQCIRPCFEPT